MHFYTANVKRKNAPQFFFDFEFLEHPGNNIFIKLTDHLTMNSRADNTQNVAKVLIQMSINFKLFFNPFSPIFGICGPQTFLIEQEILIKTMCF